MISRPHFEAIEQSNASDDAELDILNEKFRFRWRLKNCQFMSLFDDKFLRLQTLLTGGNLSTYLIDMWLSTLFSNVELDGIFTHQPGRLTRCGISPANINVYLDAGFHPATKGPY